MRNKIQYGFFTIAFIIGMFAIVLPSCRVKDEVRMSRTGAIVDRSAVPVLEARKITTLISDSGVTRYRIIADTWLIYDKADPSYWEFPDGIYIEKFDEQLNVNASIRAKYAHYDEQNRVWQLNGDVYALNQQSEVFETQELFWQQDSMRVYSDSAIKITKEASIIEGVGFVSNQELTKYTIKNPTGVFPINDN